MSISRADGATTMHRADMVDVFVRHLPSRCMIHTSKRLLSYSEPTTERGAYILHFADGTEAQADVIVGADGIKSKTRAAMYAHAHVRECLRTNTSTDASAPEDHTKCARCKGATPKWTGTVAYRYLIPSERMHAVNPAHNALHIKAPLSVSFLWACFAGLSIVADVEAQYSGKSKVRAHNDDIYGGLELTVERTAHHHVPNLARQISELDRLRDHPRCRGHDLSP